MEKGGVFMKKSFRKTLAVILSVVIISAFFALTVAAEDGGFSVPMPDYDLNIFEQIAAFFMGIWKYLMSFLPF